MILQCPACNARYAVPDHALGAAGRNVRCARCANQWFAKPNIADISPEALEKLLSEPQKPKATPVPKGSNLPAKTIEKPSPMLYALVAASLVAAIFTTVFSHKPGLFGLSSTKNIVFSELALADQKTASGHEYGISGKLVNLSNAATKLPIIRITLVDKDGNALKNWYPEGVDMLAPNETKPFNFAPLTTALTTGDRLVLELGNDFELALRAKP